jgi:hypothetical protein
MKRTLLIIFILVSYSGVYAQKDSAGSKRYPFVSFNNPNANRRLKEGRYLTLHLYTDTGSMFTYSGRIYVGDTNTLLMIGGTVEYNGFTDGGMTYEDRVTTNPADEVTVVPHNEIDYVSVIPRLKPVFGTLVIASLVPIFVFVPLASVGYTTKNFNSSELVEISAVSLVVNAALYKIFKKRKFHIKSASAKKK